MGKIKRRKKKKGCGCFIIFLIAVCIAAGGIYAGTKICKQLLFPSDYEEYISKYSSANGLDHYLVMAVIKTESNFIPDADSGKATGLMQLTEETGKWTAKKLNIDYDEIDLEDPEDNIMLGCCYLKYLIDYYKNVDVALAAYNGGMGNVDKWLKDKRYSDDKKTLHDIPFKETREYVERVNSQWKRYKEIYGKQ